MFQHFLSRIREEQEAVGEAGAMPGSDGFTLAAFKAEDVPVGTKLFTIPPATPYCPRQLDNGGMSETAVICGDQSSVDVLISKIQRSSQECNCKELVEALEKYADPEEWSGYPWKLLFNSSEYDGDGYSIAEMALAKHKGAK
jgi:hypothetical protein